MPIYEYECQKCGEIFEVMQKISDPPPAEHECGSQDIKRVMSRSSFILKGDGWYLTDYARKGKANTQSNGNGAQKAGSTSSADKADSKSEGKSEGKSGESGKSSGAGQSAA